jgi:dCTP deaminase
VNTVERALFPEMYDENGGQGILPWQVIKRMAAAGRIGASPDIEDSQIQPASIDLRLGPKAFRVQGSFLKGHSATLMTRVQELTDDTIDLTLPTPPLLERGVVYIIPLLERLNLPPDVYGVANPKSTTGRLDIFTRLITECGDEFDRVPLHYSGELYLEVSSRTFPIRVKTGMSLNQLRFVRGNPEHPKVLRNGALRELAKESPLVYDADGKPTTDPIGGDGIQITVDLSGRDHPIVAYKGKESQRAIELDKVKHYDPSAYWEVIRAPRSGYIILDTNGFYLLASKDRVSVPLGCAAEMVAYDASMGEFRVHYAGFFDPGFGFGANGEIQGTKAVLEVRAYEVPILLEDGHVVGRLNYYPMASVPKRVYGTSIGSSYQQQGLALSKQFKRLDLAEPEMVSSHSEQSTRQ